MKQINKYEKNSFTNHHFYYNINLWIQSVRKPLILKTAKNQQEVVVASSLSFAAFKTDASKTPKINNQLKEKSNEGEKKSTRGKHKNIPVFIAAGLVIISAIVIR